jgi:hypothetical protein
VVWWKVTGESKMSSVNAGVRYAVGMLELPLAFWRLCMCLRPSKVGFLHTGYVFIAQTYFLIFPEDVITDSTMTHGCCR